MEVTLHPTRAVSPLNRLLDLRHRPGHLPALDHGHVHVDAVVVHEQNHGIHHCQNRPTSRVLPASTHCLVLEALLHP